MDWSHIGGAGTLITAFIALTKLFSERWASRSSGKRLSYSFYTAASGSWRENLSLRFFPGLRKSIGRKPEHSTKSRIVDVFVWNSGAEAISDFDFFDNKEVRLKFFHAEVSKVKVFYQSHAAVGSFGYIAEYCPEWGQASHESSAVRIFFKYLPPGHGAIFRVTLVDVKVKVPQINLIGPIKGLRRTRLLGTLVSLPLHNLKWLKRLKTWINTVVNLSLALMGLAIIIIVATGSLAISSRNYWMGIGFMGLFEVIYLISRDIRSQLFYRIPNRLAYWDPSRAERD